MTTAGWSMQQSDATHWYSVIECPHGQTRNGVWLQRPIEDDRNFVGMAEPTFANHQAVTGCTCDTLAQDWTPSFTLPTARADKVSALVVPDQRSALATFLLQSMHMDNVPSWWRASETCPHGMSQHGIWLGAPGMPDIPSVKGEQELNHQRVIGCDCTIAPASTEVTAINALSATTVPNDATVAIPQAGGILASGFMPDGQGRLGLTQPGTISVTATFTLLRSVAQGGGGFCALRLPLSTEPDLTVPSVITAAIIDVNGVATGSLAYTGEAPAGISFEVDYWNGTGVIQDILSGGRLTVVFDPS